MVLDGVSGLVVEPANVEQFASALRQIIQQPDLALRLSAGARRMAQTALSWTSIAERTASVYVQSRALRRASGGVAESAT
jgi:glycosyltransferase involved in cell wall biosynthesis